MGRVLGDVGPCPFFRSVAGYIVRCTVQRLAGTQAAVKSKAAGATGLGCFAPRYLLPGVSAPSSAISSFLSPMACACSARFAGANACWLASN